MSIFSDVAKIKANSDADLAVARAFQTAALEKLAHIDATLVEILKVLTPEPPPVVGIDVQPSSPVPRS